LRTIDPNDARASAGRVIKRRRWSRNGGERGGQIL